MGTCKCNKRLKKVNRMPTTPKKVCPQCQSYLDNSQFTPNVYTEDGLNILCDTCYKKASESFASETMLVPTPETRAAFSAFVDFQHRTTSR